MSRAQPSGRSLSRARGDGRPAAPVRLVHLGLGNFFRAHQAWYTDRAPDAADWGIAAFTGRSGALADSLTAQDGLYTLITRAAEGDRFEVVSSLTRTHPGDRPRRLAGLPRLPGRACGDAHGHRGRRTSAAPTAAWTATAPRSAPTSQALRGDPAAPVHTAPARLVAGCAARRRADAGPLALVSCDNLPGNGEALARVVADLAEMVDPGLAEWMDASVSFVTTMVDRITPRTTPEDRQAVADGTGRDDCCPVATEPFSEWVLSGAFPGGRPGLGRRRRDDHRRHRALRAPQALAAQRRALDPGLRRLRPRAPDRRRGRGRRHLPGLDAAVVGRGVAPPRPAGGRRRTPTATALLDRFANPRMHHRLAQIAADGSQKLPVRILPVLRAGAGRGPDARGRDPGAGRLGVPPARRRRPGRRRPRRPDGRARRRSAARRHPARARRAGPRRRSGRRAGRGRARRTPGSLPPSRPTGSAT